MKLKLTIDFKNGSKVKIFKQLSTPPKGTDIDTHYMLESYDLVEKIQENGLQLCISPAQIEKIFIQPRGEAKDGSLRKSSQDRPAVQGAGL